MSASDTHWTAVCQYPGKDTFRFYSPAFTVRAWSELEATARQAVEDEWAKISPYPAPPIVELVPGYLGFVPGEGAVFLNRDELRELSGWRQRRKVCEWLRANGYRFDLAADGWPKVLRAAVEARLMPATRKRAATEPDFSVYDTPKKAA